MARPVICGLLPLLLSMSASAQIIFADGFEPPETNFSNWSYFSVAGANVLQQSTELPFSGTQSMKVVFSGSGQDLGLAVYDFDGGYPNVYARMQLFVPAATQTAMKVSTELRVLRLGDKAPSFPDRFSLYLRRDSSGAMWLRPDIRISDGGVFSPGTVATMGFDAGSWLPVEVAWEPTLSQVRVTLSSAPEVVFSSPALGSRGIRDLSVGLVQGADNQTNNVLFYIDDVVLSAAAIGDGGLSDGGIGDGGVGDGGFADAGLVDAGAGFDGGTDGGSAQDAGSGSDGGVAESDGGADEQAVRIQAAVGCDCGHAGLAPGLLALIAAVGARRRSSRRG